MGMPASWWYAFHRQRTYVRTAPVYIKQVRTMTAQGPDLFLCVLLRFRQFIVLYSLSFHLCPVPLAIAGNGYLFPSFSHADGNRRLSLLYICGGGKHYCR